VENYFDFLLRFMGDVEKNLIDGCKIEFDSGKKLSKTFFCG
jgi:hypothetical protein